tara:strand:+ start:5365 stop:5928 length:564 start_codon:yes stop_codon:yes gene_type:complete
MPSFDVINANSINSKKSLWSIEDVYRLPNSDNLQTYSDISQNDISLTENTFIGSSYLFGCNYTGISDIENSSQFDPSTGLFTANLSGTYLVTYSFKLPTTGFIYFVAKDSNGNRLSSSFKTAYYKPPHDSGVTKDTMHTSGDTVLYLEKGGTIGFECMDPHSIIFVGERANGQNGIKPYSGFTILRL